MAVIHSSLTKIFRWVCCLATEDFYAGGVLYKYPRGGVQIWDSMTRDVVCPPNCGGCCTKFDLLYFKECQDNLLALKKYHPKVFARLEKTTIEVNGVDFEYFVEPEWVKGTMIPKNSQYWKNYFNSAWTNPDSPIAKCVHLKLDDASCGIWGAVGERANPIHCQLLPIHLHIQRLRGQEVAILGKKKFSRGWKMSPPAKCIIQKSSRAQFFNDINNIKQICLVAEGMNIRHRGDWLARILEKRLIDVHGE